jgi:hypothetical protein
MSFHGLLAFRVCVEKSDVILMDLPLYVKLSFVLCGFQYSFFVLCIEYFYCDVSWAVSFVVLMVWCSVSFLPLYDSLSKG